MKWILLLCFFCVLTEGFPGVPARFQRISSFLDPMYQKREEADDCGKALSDAVIDVINLVVESPQLRPLPYNADVHRELLVHLLGYDVFDDDVRQEKCCELTKVTTVSELKEVQNNVLFSQLRFAYDYMITFYPMALDGVSPETQELVATLESLGLASLDPKGVNRFIEIIGLGFLIGGYTPVNVSTDSLHEKCATLQNIVNSAIASSTQANPDAMKLIRDDIYKYTDVDIEDTEQLNALLCDVMVGVGEGSLRAVYDIIDDNGVLDKMVHTYYPEFVQYIQETKEQLEGLATLLEYAVNNGPPHGKGKGYGKRDGIKRHHGKPHGDDDSISETLKLLKAALKMIEEVEKAGLLDLPE